MDLQHAPVVGVIGPQTDGRDAPFWDGLQQGRLLIPHCPRCGTWVWPVQWACPECHRFSPDWEAVEPRGTIFTWTRTWQRFSVEFADLVPFLNVVVELDEAGGTRLIGLLLGDDTVEPILGEPVTGVVQPGSELTGGAAILRWQRSGRQ